MTDERRGARRQTAAAQGEEAGLDEGRMWPTAYALTGLSAPEEERIAALVQQATS